MSQLLFLHSTQHWRAIAFALASLTASGCAKPTQEAEKKEMKGEPSPAVDAETVKNSFETLRTKVKDQVEAFRRLRARVNDFPVDLVNLPEFKERIGQTESVLGALDGRIDWLAGELEVALKENSPDRIRTVSDQVGSISGDIKATASALLTFAHDLRQFDEAVALQTSWVHKLPSGYEIKAAPGGLERRLIDFSTDPTRKFEPHSWYRFDRLYFFDIRTDINRSLSDAQLKNVVEILKAYPALELELSAFDRDAQRMQEIRERTTERLQGLRKELLDRGIAPTRIRVLEFGPDCPPDALERCRGSVAARPVVK